MLKHSTHLETGSYLDTLLENSLLPLITLPTRIAHNSATLLNHIRTNICDDNLDSGIIISDISDHFPIFYIRHFKDRTPKDTQELKIRKYDDASVLKFKQLLENSDWNSILNNNDPESAFHCFFF